LKVFLRTVIAADRARCCNVKKKVSKTMLKYSNAVFPAIKHTLKISYLVFLYAAVVADRTRCCKKTSVTQHWSVITHCIEQ